MSRTLIVFNYRESDLEVKKVNPQDEKFKDGCQNHVIGLTQEHINALGKGESVVLNHENVYVRIVKK